MHYVSKTFLSAAVIVMAGAAAQAQDAPSATVNDPPGPVPDPGHIPFTPPDKVAWTGSPTGQQQVTLFGDPSKPGMYGVLIKWNPGAFSKPHFHDQERYIYVVSGTWWVNSGASFEPDATVPVPAGGFVRRVAHTPHYDGVRKGGKEPAVIGIFGQAPIEFKLIDPSKPPVRPV